jgi:hypothetical protein
MEIVKNARNSVYDKFRAIARIASIAIPGAAYAATTNKLNEYDGFFNVKGWIANLFYGGDLNKLDQINDYSAKGIGVGAALIGVNQIDKRIEKTFPNSPKIRKVAYPIGYVAAANVLNSTKSAITELVKEASSLESKIQGAERLIMDSNSSKKYEIANSVFDSVRENFIETLNTTFETISNAPQIYDGSDLESMTNMAISTFIAIPTLSIGSKILKKGYDVFVGSPSKDFQERRIDKNLLGQSKDLEKEVKARRKSR